MPKNELYNLPPHEDKFLTEQEVRAIISSSQENFTAPATVKTGHWKSNNFISGSTGWKIKANGDCEFNSGTFRGKLIAGSIHIPDETTANSFHTETDGDSYWGCNVADWASDNNNANAYILKTGSAKFQNILLEGSVILKDLQAGSVVSGTYVDALAVGKLTAGTILSKAISLGVTGGSGDCYISGGAGLDYANWTADKGFILGLDDSDGDKAKFFIGDHANDKYLSWYGTNLDATSMRLLTPFTAGEDLTTGDIVCIKTGDNTYSTGIHDSWVIASLPDSNFGTGAELRCGVSTYAFLSFDMTNPVIDSPINVVYAELVLTATSIPASDSTITLSTLAASFDESTVTYNTKPASNFNLTYLFGMETQKILATSDNIGDTVTFDVTQWVRQIFAGNETNNGFQIVGSVACRFASSEHATSSYRPYIKVYTLANSGDGKVYKSNCDDYRLCRSIMGVSVENASADDAIRIQSTGVNNSMTALGVGQNYYISSTDGELTVDSNQLRPILFGKGIATTNILIEKQNQDFMSEYSYSTVTWQASSEARKIYFPYGARFAAIRFSLGGAENIVNVYRDHAKMGLGSFRIHAENSATVNAYISWGSNYLQVAPVFQNSSFKYIFYT